jgi:hypothetical protein
MGGIHTLAEEMLASQEVLCSMELVSQSDLYQYQYLTFKHSVWTWSPCTFALKCYGIINCLQKCLKIKHIPRNRKSTTSVITLSHFLIWRNILVVPWFQASAAMLMKYVVFWVITRRRVVIIYRRFGTTYRSHLHGSRCDPWRWDRYVVPKRR